MMPALGASKCDKAYGNFYRKFYGVMAILVLTAVIEIIFQAANAAIPEVAVDASVWLIWGVIFIGHFGTFPSDWKLGKRPKGIVMMLVLTLLTIAGFYLMQVATGESIGSGVLETRLSNAGLSQNAGLSLMMSCWLVFWTIAVGAAGYCDPGQCRPAETKA
jgi:FtsH-binding integral membrane protein